MVSSALIERVKALCQFPTEAESTRIISGLRWIGLFSEEKVKPRGENLLDTLCAQLETLMKYEEGERDLVMLQHKFVVEWADGKVVSSFTSHTHVHVVLVVDFCAQDTLTSTLEQYGSPNGHSAMALTVGLPCGIASQLILDGKLTDALGVQAPYSKEICDPIREILESHGVGLVERVL